MLLLTGKATQPHSLSFLPRAFLAFINSIGTVLDAADTAGNKVRVTTAHRELAIKWKPLTHRHHTIE